MVQQSSGLSSLQPIHAHAHTHPHEAGGYLAPGGDAFPPQLPSPLSQGSLLYPHQQHQQLTNDSGNYFQQQPPNSGKSLVLM